VWDPAAQKWAGAGGKAMSKVTLKPLYSKWHNGIPMDRADLMYAYYFTFEWGTNLGDNDKTTDPEFTSVAAPNLPLIKGVKFAKDGSIESYADFWHYDDKEIADFAAVWASEPWEITAATERLVIDGKLAYSLAQAKSHNVDWLDMVVPEHAQMIKQELQKMKSENYVPAALKGTVSASDAKKRYDASIKWIDDHKNAVISNGPFYLDSYNIAGRTITVKAFRDSSYPFAIGHFSSFENPKLAKIAKVDIPKALKVGKPVKATVTVAVDGKPSSDAEVNYFISNKAGNVVVKGTAKAGKAGTFTIDVPASQTAKLSVGPNQFKVFASGSQAFKPDIASVTVLVTRS
jgi:peptide/nickel transport system substrate-binding protein